MKKQNDNGAVAFRWDGEQLLVTTPQGQYRLDAEHVMDLLVHLYDHREDITEALHRLPGWARPDQTTNVAEERQKRLASLTALSPVITIDGDATAH